MTATTLLFFVLLGHAAPPSSIGIYDLTYALKFDAADPRQVADAWDHAHAVATLQGLVNRDAPRLYVRFVSSRGINYDDYWLDRLSAPGQWLEHARRQPIPDLPTLVNTYRRFFKGVVLYDPKVPDTSNLASTTAGGKHEGVPTEWEMVRITSAYNALIDADALGDAAMANASFYQHFPLKAHYAQPWTTRKELTDRGYLTRDGHVRFDGRQFIIFYAGDFDSAAWVYQWMPRLWDDPDRGKVPLMWCISPIIERRAHMALDYLRRTASQADYFAAADNGAGYLNPGMLQEPRAVSGLPDGLNVWARHLAFTS